jgi:pimeloyl-ACP methyl ester carboxylesterase
MAALEAIFDWDFCDRLPEIRCPTLIIWGRDDMVISVEDADGYEDAIPGARQLVLEDTGHVPQLERPQTFNELLLDFLAERGGLEAAA